MPESARGGTTTRLTFDEFLHRAQEPGKRFELDRGELIIKPSPTLRHNAICVRIALHLRDFVLIHRLGCVAVTNYFQLAPDVVRCADIAFVATERLRWLDADRPAMDGAPDLAIEVISANDLAEDMLAKVHQYLNAACRAVWLFYPTLKLVKIHNAHGAHEIAVPGSLEDESVFGGRPYSLPLSPVFDDDITK